MTAQTNPAPVDVRRCLRMAMQHVLICAPDPTVQKAIEDADAAVAELIDAVAYALRTRDEAGALSDTAEHNLRAALADCGGES